MKRQTVMKYVDKLIEAMNEIIPPSSLVDNPHRVYLYKGGEYLNKHYKDNFLKPYIGITEVIEWGKKESGKWDGYPPRRRKALEMHYCFNSIKNVINKDRLIIDGMITLSLKKVKSGIPGVIVYKAEWLKKGRGISAEFVKGYIAEYKGFFFHTNTKKDAEIKVVAKRKRAITNKRKARILARIRKHQLEKIFVTRQDSIDAGNCAPGTDNWINRHNLQDRESISLKELLEIQPGNSYVRSVVDYALIKYSEK